MGVKGLQYYCENHSPHICCQVSIPELASYHTVPRGENPVLLVDGMGLINKTVCKERDWAFGGQWREYVTTIKNFVKRFEDVGIKLIFFYDGPSPASKMNEWISRRLRRMQDVKKAFDFIKNTGRHPPEDMFQVPASMGSLTRYILMHECNCQIFSTIREADQEMSDFANRNPNCFAILSQDSDFMIYDTKPYLSISHLKMHNLTTVMYDRKQLAREIGLEISQFPLFSSMIGNDVIQFDALRSFHRELCGCYRIPPVKELIPKVAEFIRRNADIGNDIPSIARLLRIDERLLRDSLYVYSPLTNPNEPPDFINASSHCSPEVLSLVFFKGVNGQCPALIYVLLSQRQYSSSELMEDGADSTMQPAALIFRPMRRRSYAILFGTSGSPVKEMCAYDSNPMTSPEMVSPLPLDFRGSIPPLQLLWSDHRELDQVRWGLFASCVGVSFPRSDLQKVPLQYVALCCTLNYLLLNDKAIQLAPWEIVAFVYQAISPHLDNPNYILQLRIPHVISRAVQLASTFLRGISTVDTIHSICGQPYPYYYNMPWHYFDGKLFHHYYGLLKNGTTVESLCKQEGGFHELSILYNIIVTGTPLSRTALTFGRY